MTRNYNDMVKSRESRTLTAKGYQFVWKCIDIMADVYGLNRYSSQLREKKDQISKIIEHLLIDKGMSRSDVITVIKNRKSEIFGQLN